MPVNETIRPPEALDPQAKWRRVYFWGAATLFRLAKAKPSA
jgi:hypothetical protein